jgi:hypothetical protein
MTIYGIDFEDIKKVGAWLGGGLASLVSFVKLIVPWWEARQHHRRVVTGLQTLHTIYSQMERAEALGASRAVIFGGHNSGGLPRPNSPYYTSALHWHVPDSKSARISDYQELPVDAHYIRMLLDIERDGYVRFDLSANAPDSLLRRIYAAEKIVDSVIFFLCITDHTFFYLTFASYTRRFTDEEITKLHLKAQIISKAIRSSV